jgi:2-polyprenyl-6-methoxyphenol hydroxylase-like FAD-dependent oxidoreductase
LEGGGERVRYLIGADGPNFRSRPSSASVATRSSVWREAEYEGIAGMIPNACIARPAPGARLHRLGGAGYGLMQVGLACRQPDRPQLDAFERKLARLFDFSGARRVGRRGGLIPVGGPVSPPAGRGVALIGDAAGLVSPLSAGGIHTALESGFLAAQALADQLLEGFEDPGRVIARQHPHYVFKRALRIVFDRGIPDRVFDAALATRAFTALARSVYFHHRGLRSAEGWRDLAQTLFRGH